MNDTYTGSKVQKKMSKKSDKIENFEKSIFSIFFATLIANLQKNQLNLNKKLFAVTRRAGCLILTSESNTDAGKIEPGGLAT